MEAPEQADSLPGAAAHPLVEALHALLAAWDAPPASPRLVHLLAQCPTSFLRKATDGEGLPPLYTFLHMLPARLLDGVASRAGPAREAGAVLRLGGTLGGTLGPVHGCRLCVW